MTQSNNTPGAICAEEYVVKRGDSFYLIAHKLGVPLRDLLAANRDIHPARLMVGDILCIPREEDDSAEGGLGGGATGGNSTGGSTGGSTSNGSSTGDSTSGSTSSGSSTGGSTSGSTSSGSSTGGSTSGSTSSGSSTGGSTSGSMNSGSSTTPTTPVEPTPNCPLDEQWIIQRGQTVSDIQIRNLVSRNTLESANPEVDLDSLRVGQTICVPKENIPCSLPSSYTLAPTETLEAVAIRFNLPVASILRANPCLAPQDFEPGITIMLPR